MKYILLLAAITISACATPAASKEPVPQEVIQQEQKEALEIISEMSKIENTPQGELTIAMKSRHRTLNQKLKTMRGNHIFAGRSADHLSLSALIELLRARQ